MCMMYEYRHHDAKPKYGDDAELWYTDIYDMIHIYAELARGFEKRFNSSNYEVKRPLLIRKNKKVMK